MIIILGKLPPDAIPGDSDISDCMLGTEFAGKTTCGRRVMGIMDSKVNICEFICLKKVIINQQLKSLYRLSGK